MADEAATAAELAEVKRQLAEKERKLTQANEELVACMRDKAGAVAAAVSEVATVKAERDAHQCKSGQLEVELRAARGRVAAAERDAARFDKAQAERDALSREVDDLRHAMQVQVEAGGECGGDAADVTVADTVEMKHGDHNLGRAVDAQLPLVKSVHAAYSQSGGAQFPVVAAAGEPDGAAAAANPHDLPTAKLTLEELTQRFPKVTKCPATLLAFRSHVDRLRAVVRGDRGAARGAIPSLNYVADALGIRGYQLCQLVVGLEDVGKSSVINMLANADVLYCKGGKTATRRPTELTLEYDEHARGLTGIWGETREEIAAKRREGRWERLSELRAKAQQVNEELERRDEFEVRCLYVVVRHDNPAEREAQVLLDIIGLHASFLESPKTRDAAVAILRTVLAEYTSATTILVEKATVYKAHASSWDTLKQIVDPATRAPLLPEPTVVVFTNVDGILQATVSDYVKGNVTEACAKYAGKFFCIVAKPASGALPGDQLVDALEAATDDVVSRSAELQGVADGGRGNVFSVAGLRGMVREDLGRKAAEAAPLLFKAADALLARLLVVLTPFRSVRPYDVSEEAMRMANFLGDQWRETIRGLDSISVSLVPEESDFFPDALREGRPGAVGSFGSEVRDVVRQFPGGLAVPPAASFGTGCTTLAEFCRKRGLAVSVLGATGPDDIAAAMSRIVALSQGGGAGEIVSTPTCACEVLSSQLTQLLHALRLHVVDARCVNVYAQTQLGQKDIHTAVMHFVREALVVTWHALLAAIEGIVLAMLRRFAVVTVARGFIRVPADKLPSLVRQARSLEATMMQLDAAIELQTSRFFADVRQMLDHVRMDDESWLHGLASAEACSALATAEAATDEKLGQVTAALSQGLSHDMAARMDAIRLSVRSHLGQLVQDEGLVTRHVELRATQCHQQLVLDFSRRLKHFFGEAIVGSEGKAATVTDTFKDLATRVVHRVAVLCPGRNGEATMQPAVAQVDNRVRVALLRKYYDYRDEQERFAALYQALKSAARDSGEADA